MKKIGIIDEEGVDKIVTTNGALGGVSNSGKHLKCMGVTSLTDCGYEYDCLYNSSLECEECKYGGGKKDPEAKCNK